RLILITFHGQPRERELYDRAGERGMVVLIPLAFLGAGSILAGFPFAGLFTGPGAESFFRDSLKFTTATHLFEEMHHLSFWVSIAPTVMMALGFIVAWVFYVRRPELPVALARQHEPLYKFLLNKWYFDEIYDALFVRPAIWLGRLL